MSMKVTDEMVEAAYEQMIPGPLGPRAVKLMLEAALADVESYEELKRSIRAMQVILVNAHKWRATAEFLSGVQRPDFEQLNRILLEDHETEEPMAGVTRIEELEAKLAKVRERAEDIGLNEADVAYLLSDD
jgi:BMFP domain-containing protein YqiC